MKKSRFFRLIRIGWIVFILVGCGDTSYLQMKDEPLQAETEEALSGDPSPEEDGTGTDTFYVQVAGAVKHPGVYELPAGSRLFEAIDLAGGMTDEAYDDQINQASFVTDGQKIYIPTEAERAEENTDEVGQDDGKVNINTAGESELMQLSGIGASKAALIVRYREEHGDFSSIEDIMKVEGIKEGTYNKICDQIKL